MLVEKGLKKAKTSNFVLILKILNEINCNVRTTRFLDYRSIVDSSTWIAITAFRAMSLTTKRVMTVVCKDFSI